MSQNLWPGSVSVSSQHSVIYLSSWDELKLMHLAAVSISPVDIFILSHNQLWRSHICEIGKMWLCTWWELEAFLLRAFLLWFSGPSAVSCPVCLWGARAVDIMADAGVGASQAGRTVASLAARVNWVLLCPCALGTGIAVGALWTLQGNLGLRRGSLLVLGCFQTCLNFKAATCPGLSRIAVDDACWMDIINSTSFNSSQCPGVFETLHGPYIWSLARSQEFYLSLSPEGRWGIPWCCCVMGPFTLV